METSGLTCTGTCQALNSYENRVYEVEVEDTSGSIGRRIVKFYLPGRWSDDAILEDPAFPRAFPSLGTDRNGATRPLVREDGRRTMRVFTASTDRHAAIPANCWP